MELTPTQCEILNALINLYQKDKSAVKGEKVASAINRNPGTIRNQMQSLKALELIEGVPGPKGGYKPTSRAYAALDYESFDEGEPVQIFLGGEQIEGATATEIDLTTLPQPDQCKATIRILGDIKSFEGGDEIQIGPTPVNKMLIRGEVAGRDDLDNKLIIRIKEIHSIPIIPVKQISSDNLITIDHSESIQSATSKMYENNIKGAPVVQGMEIVGMVTLTDIAKAVGEGKVEIVVEDVMTREIISISGDSTLDDAMIKLDEHDISRLLVIEDGEPTGIITMRDILRRLVPFNFS
ncbi:putative transcriptional regulator containing C-terminal CBS domain [Methanonatronarchaeum thermophilum]|uniref:Putative transcriptional regulator containing C-terminal CBS domain n=1 Tax=Methanonatronarchaeum thermophilum TaxID=1927129 RepID=A0A1Y3GH55_9EURY|nr:CBS domain-containing protein [Methanonatronarchaeum thermophilum]OUJ18706.1 putative transcriptional regulator containing C-terminal CBS domain [Methanonatronarchaeum thermophilum]